MGVDLVYVCIVISVMMYMWIRKAFVWLSLVEVCQRWQVRGSLCVSDFAHEVGEGEFQRLGCKVRLME